MCERTTHPLPMDGDDHRRSAGPRTRQGTEPSDRSVADMAARAHDHHLDHGITGEHPSAVFAPPVLPGAATAPDEIVPVAFLGRVSTDDLQDPTLSLPRQLGGCRAALPANHVIVAFFWDVESGRKDLADRGTGAHDLFTIPGVPRDGGMPELLAEAKRPDRRFGAVICETIERSARGMYAATNIEHQLDRAKVPLWAADEGVETIRKKSAALMLRMFKQTWAEVYAQQMLDLAWDGFCEHTRQGWNIGVPPYGYRAEKLNHPNPLRAAEGKTKTKLVPDDDRGATVTVIFVWRVTERLSYAAIRDRLNADLDRHPVP